MAAVASMIYVEEEGRRRLGDDDDDDEDDDETAGKQGLRTTSSQPRLAPGWLQVLREAFAVLGTCIAVLGTCIGGMRVKDRSWR